MKKILLVLSLFILTGCNYSIIEEQETTLKEIYKDYFDIGAAVTSFNLDSLNDEYTTFTAEYEMKWDQLEETKDEYNFDSMDIIANYIRENDMKLRGHTIVWYQTTPEFIHDIKNLNISIEDKIDLCLEHIEDYYQTVYDKYGDILTCYDVVNEVISDSNNPNELYRSNDPYYEMFGYSEEYFEYFIKEVLKIVKEISPNVTRYYNDYFVITNYTKRNKINEFISRINKEEKLIEGMGAQSHITVSVTQEEVINTLNTFRNLNVEFSFTELDISSYENSYDPQVTYDELSLARAYNAIFTVARDNKDIVSNITFWGINDSMTWLDKDDRKDYPLLFDVNGNKKYAYYVISKFGGVS